MKFKPYIIFFCLGFILFSLASLFKYNIAADEQVYLANGQYFLQHFSYMDAKYLPMYGILLAMLNYFIASPLFAAKMLYAIFGGLISIPFYNISCEFFSKREASFSAIILLCTPGLLILPLYAGTHLVFIFFAYSGIALFIKTLKSNQVLYAFLAGIFLGAAYLTRMDGLVYIVLLLMGFVLSILMNREYQKVPSIIFIIIGIVLVILPWQIWLYNQGHIIGTVAKGVTTQSKIWHPGIMSYFVSGHAAIYLHNPLLIIGLLAESIRVYSERMASIRYIPIVLWIFVGLGLMRMTWNKYSWVLFVPVVGSFSYLLYFVSTRYLTGMLPVIILFAAPGLLAFNDWLAQKFNIKAFVLVILLMLAILDFSYCVLGHPTENQIIKPVLMNDPYHSSLQTPQDQD